jgi:hypothetical protein
MATHLGVERAAPRPAPQRPALAGQVSQRAGYLAVPLVTSTLLVVWLISGVSVGDIARFLAFEALYVVLPGCLLYLLLSPASWELSPPAGARLRVLAVGWPLGYALEIGAFALTAVLHARGVFAFLPLLAVATLGPGVVYRRRRARSSALVSSSTEAAREGALGSGALGGGLRGGGLSRGRDRGAESLLAAGAIALALVLLAVRYFAIYPLPEHAGSVFYFVDNVWDVSSAAEALHHWPLTESFLAGHPFRYYIGVFLHVAAIKQVMGVSLATAIFRLVPATSTVVAMLQFWCLGGLLGRSRWAGPVTVALLVFVENLKLFPTHTKVFGVALFSEFTWSPTYGFGVIFLLGLLILFRSQFPGVSTTGSLAPPVPAGSLARPVPADSPAPPAPAGSPAQPELAGSSARPVPAGSLTPPGAVGSLPMLGILVLGAGAVKTTAVATFVAGLGLLWLWQLVRKKADRLLSYWVVLSLACFAATYLLLLYGPGAPATTETKLAPLDFMKYTVFGSTLAAHSGFAPLLGAAAVIVLWKLLPAAAAVWPVWRRGAWSPYASLALALFVVGFTVYVMMGSPGDNENYFIWYGYIALIPLGAVSLMAVWSDVSTGVRRAIGRLPSRGARVAVCGALLLGVLGGAESIALAVPDTWKTLLDRQTVPRDSPSEPGMTAALYRGLIWVRDHTPSCAILAVNTPEIRPAGATTATADSGYFYYSAFTEREVFFESWIMTIQGQHGEQPYPGLYALNRAATLRGSPAAVRELARRGVSYILSDTSHGGDVRESSSVGRLVFANSALDVYRLTVPVSNHNC